MPRPKNASATSASSPAAHVTTYFALLEDPALRKQVSEFIEQVEFPKKRGEVYKDILAVIAQTKNAKWFEEWEKANIHAAAGKMTAELGAKAKRVTAVKKHIAKAASRNRKHHHHP